MADHTGLAEKAHPPAASAGVADTGQKGSIASLSVQVEEMPLRDLAQKVSPCDVLEGEAADEEADETGLIQLESLCMNCHENVCCSWFIYFPRAL